MTLDDALVAAQRGRAVVIFGAGFSLEATLESGQPVQDTRALAAALLDDLGSPESLDYTLAADLYARTLGEESLRSFLRPRMAVRDISDSQKEIISTPWRRIYTTNFDNLIEVGQAALSIKGRSLTPRDDPSQLPRDATWVVHLHGYLFEGESHAKPFPLILTRSSYIEPVLQRTQWPTQLQLDIESADALFIVGYSVSDFHIARLLRPSRSIINKTQIVIENDPSPALAKYLSQFGQVHNLGLDGLAAKLKSAASDVPDIDFTVPLICFEETIFPTNTVVPTTDSVVSLLSSGVIDDNILAHSIVGDSPPYCIHRNYALHTLNTIKDGRNRYLFHSSIGNGKSVFLRQLSLELARSNYRVFHARHATYDFHAEIDSISSLIGRKAFIFDGYRDFSKLIAYISTVASPNDVIIVGARTSEIQYLIGNQSTTLGSNFTKVNLDNLTDIELTEIEALISYYGLWGSTAGSTSAQRKIFIQDRCDREIRSVILHLFNKTPLGDRIKSAFVSLANSSDDAMLVFTGSLIARLADAPIDFYDVCELMEADHFATRERLRNSGAGEFFHIADDDFRARSAVLAHFSLSQIIPPDMCLRAISQMVDSLTQLIGADDRYETAIPRLLRFSIISRVFQGASRRDFIIKFYESMLGIGLVRKNPQFWVQYAMARMERLEYALADKCFQNAYTEAKKMARYDSFMIDNQYVKFLLYSRMNGIDYEDYGAALMKAVPLVRRQINLMSHSPDIHVLRLAEPMRQYLQKHSARLTATERSTLLDVMKSMVKRVQDMGGEKRLDEDERRLFFMLSN